MGGQPSLSGDTKPRLRVLQQVWPKQPAFTYIIPTDGGPTLTPEQRLVRRYLKASLVVVAIGELHKQQSLVPSLAVVQDTCEKHVLKGLNYPLILAIALRVEGCAENYLCSHSLLQSPLELGYKARVPIRHD